MVYRHKFGAEYPLHIPHAQGLPLLVDAAPKRTFVAVGHRSEPLLPVLPADFGHAGNLVPTEIGQFHQTGFDFFDGNVFKRFLLGLGSLLAGHFRAISRMQLAVFVGTVGVARTDVAFYAVGVVIRKTALQPFHSLVFLHPISVQQIACLADVFVAMPLPIGIAPLLQVLFNDFPDLGHHHLFIIHRKRFGFLSEEGVRVVAQHTAPCGILHGTVETGNAQQTAVMVIALIESFEISMVVGHSFHPKDDA